MRVIFCLFDSLTVKSLSCYGGGNIPTPNFDRLSARGVTFNNHFVGSLPCMPARRDLHTGRMNFMHRSWGPLEPFDNSFPDILGQNGIYSHMVTDHGHYFEDGGATYHNRYSSFDFIRGQENDSWKAMVQAPVERWREKYGSSHYPMTTGRIDDPGRGRIQHLINRELGMQATEDRPLAKCFSSALEFLDENREEDDWFLQVECFDPHEPFEAPEEFKKAFKTGWNGDLLNWPFYEKSTNSAEEIAEIRANYAALVSMCDHYFGKLLDYMDANDMWDDTALVLSTDHGFLLAEHDWWGKNLQPYYREISHIPLIIHHPKFAQKAGTRIDALTQTYDLMPTMLDMFDLPVPEEVTGQSVLSLISGADESHRDIGIFGMFGGPIGATDGRYDFYIYPDDLYAPGLHEYTLMPVHIRSRMSIEELKTAELTTEFSFTKGAPVMKIDALKNAQRIPAVDNRVIENMGSKLFDTQTDPAQESPINDLKIEARLKAGMISILEQHECPAEIFDRLGLVQGHK